MVEFFWSRASLLRDCELQDMRVCCIANSLHTHAVSSLHRPQSNVAKAPGSKMLAWFEKVGCSRGCESKLTGENCESDVLLESGVDAIDGGDDKYGDEKRGWQDIPVTTRVFFFTGVSSK